MLLFEPQATPNQLPIAARMPDRLVPLYGVPTDWIRRLPVALSRPLQ